MGLPPISIISLIVYVIIYFMRKQKEESKSFLCHFMRYSLIGCVLCLIFLTIIWGGFSLEDTCCRLLNLQPFVWLTKTYEMGFGKMIKQLLANIVMFMPYGLLIPIVFARMRSWWKTDIVVFVSSFMIEFIQYFIGRSCDVDDLIMNTVGGCIGYTIFFLMNILFREKKWYKKMIGV